MARERRIPYFGICYGFQWATVEFARNVAGLHTDKRLALVTGTSSGIGAAVAGALLRNGWHVIGLSRRAGTFDSPRYRHIEVDLSRLTELTDVADGTIAPILTGRHWSRVGLVNNAGAIGGLCSLEAMAAEDVATVFAVNAVAPMFLVGFVVRVAPPASTLRIVNISSGAATRPLPGGADYGGSKAALRLAGMTLAAELASPERPWLDSRRMGPRPATELR